MDIALELADTFLFDALYAKILPAAPASYNLKDGLGNATSTRWVFKPASNILNFPPGEAAWMSQLPRDNVYRQIFTLFLITWFSGAAIYFFVSSLSYIFVFDKTTYQHPKFLKNQIRQEIAQAVGAMPWIAVLTTPFFFAEVRGYSKLYDSLSDEPYPYYNYLVFPLFLLFTDFTIYWIHRFLHHPLIYKNLHKPHHKWIMPSPYASVAFHPVDGWLQSVPYHVFPFIFPLQKLAYLGLFAFVQIWTVIIHDGEYVSHSPILNGAACHTMHHLYFNYNYGQYTTLWDRMGGSYRPPNAELFRRETKMSQKEWEKQSEEMEKIQRQVEGDDERVYNGGEKKKN